MSYLAKNNAYSTLASSLTNVATSLSVQTGHGDRFPVIAAPDYTYITLENASGVREIVKVTARTAGADTMTVVRAQEGTTAVAWSAGDAVECRPTAGLMQTALNERLDTVNGGTVAGAVTFSNASFTLSAVAARIIADFSNATVANRAMFQSSTVNGGTIVGALPNGTATSAHFRAYSSSSPTNSSFLNVMAGASDARIESGIEGTGSYLPMTFWAGGAEGFRLDTNRRLGVGMTPNGNAQLQVSQVSSNYGFEVLAATGGTNSGIASARLLNSANTVERLGLYGNSDTLSTILAASQLNLATGGVTRVTLSSSGLESVGAFGVGTTGLAAYASAVNAAVEFALATNQPVIDFHCSNTWQDYNARITVSGAAAGQAGGAMLLDAGSYDFRVGGASKFVLDTYGNSTFNGSLNLPNNTPLAMKDTGGTGRSVLYIGTDNTVILSQYGGQRFRVLNQAQSVEHFSVGANGEIGLNSNNVGTSGQFLKSQGSGSPAVWADSPGLISFGSMTMGSGSSQSLTLPATVGNYKLILLQFNNVTTTAAATISIGSWQIRAANTTAVVGMAIVAISGMWGSGTGTISSTGQTGWISGITTSIVVSTAGTFNGGNVFVYGFA
jgi:hypothetical protein